MKYNCIQAYRPKQFDFYIENEPSIFQRKVGVSFYLFKLDPSTKWFLKITDWNFSFKFRRQRIIVRIVDSRNTLY